MLRDARMAGLGKLHPGDEAGDEFPEWAENNISHFIVPAKSSHGSLGKPAVHRFLSMSGFVKLSPKKRTAYAVHHNLEYGVAISRLERSRLN